MNEVWDSIHVPKGYVTYEEYINRLESDLRFKTDSVIRRMRLAALRSHMARFGEVPEGLVADAQSRIIEVFGNTTTKVRFRSSSNVEDALEFNAAGLYDSISGCVADDLDGNEGGYSRCDPQVDHELNVDRAIKRVWASLWNYRAYEEREYYQIPHSSAVMGILVTRAFPDEAANGVIFTGDPSGENPGTYVVNVQYGDTSVVQPDPGTSPEKDLLVMQNGQVTQIIRVRGSSLLPEGEWVLTHDQLTLLGTVMADIDAEYPVNLGGYSRDEVLLDSEFKFEWDGSLFFKQIRPFLTSSPARKGPKRETP
jgi:phosphoenolpyruvate synthase/pyruvate phosphate dikinase